MHFVHRLLHFVLNQAIRPGDADGIHAGEAAQSKYQRDARVSLLLIAGAGLHFDFGVHRELGVLHPDEPDFDPVAVISAVMSRADDRGCRQVSMRAQSRRPLPVKSARRRR